MEPLEGILTTPEPGYEYRWLYADEGVPYKTDDYYESEEAFNTRHTNRGYRVIGAITATKRKKSEVLYAYDIYGNEISKIRVKSYDELYTYVFATFAEAKEALLNGLRLGKQYHQGVVREIDAKIKRITALTEEDLEDA